MKNFLKEDEKYLSILDLILYEEITPKLEKTL